MLSLNRGGLTIVELLIVLAIISIMLAIFLPAAHAIRERAREAVCKNNVHQLNLALAHYAEAHKQLPPPSSAGKVGGWMVEILPFIEQKDLKDNLPIGALMANLDLSEFRPPSIFRCPRRNVLDPTDQSASYIAQYVFVPASRRESFLVFDSPTTLSAPWLNGPELDYQTMTKSIGPHSNGFFYARGFQQGVGFMLNGKDIR